MVRPCIEMQDNSFELLYCKPLSKPLRARAGPGLRHLVQVRDEKMGVARSNQVFQLLSSS